MNKFKYYQLIQRTLTGGIFSFCCSFIYANAAMVDRYTVDAKYKEYSISNATIKQSEKNTELSEIIDINTILKCIKLHEKNYANAFKHNGYRFRGRYHNPYFADYYYEDVFS